MVLPFDRIYCITLKRAVARRNRLAKQIERLNGVTDKHGNAIEYVWANNGQNIDFSVDNTLKRHNKKRACSQSEIGCFASHRQIWKSFLESGLETCLILEDDFVIEPLAKQVFEKWEEMPDWDYVNFGFCTNKSSIVATLRLSEIRTFRNLYQGSGMWLTHAYCINQLAAKRFLEYTEVMRGGIDWQLTGVQCVLNSYGFTNPSVIRQEKVSLSNPSFIDHTQ